MVDLSIYVLIASVDFSRSKVYSALLYIGFVTIQGFRASAVGLGTYHPRTTVLLYYTHINKKLMTFSTHHITYVGTFIAKFHAKQQTEQFNLSDTPMFPELRPITQLHLALSVGRSNQP
jgi:hypothetical protein